MNDIEKVLCNNRLEVFLVILFQVQSLFFYLEKVVYFLFYDVESKSFKNISFSDFLFENKINLRYIISV